MDVDSLLPAVILLPYCHIDAFDGYSMHILVWRSLGDSMAAVIHLEAAGEGGHTTGSSG